LPNVGYYIVDRICGYRNGNKDVRMQVGNMIVHIFGLYKIDNQIA